MRVVSTTPSTIQCRRTRTCLHVKQRVIEIKHKERVALPRRAVHGNTAVAPRRREPGLKPRERRLESCAVQWVGLKLL
jgi:hypothetical protein